MLGLIGRELAIELNDKKDREAALRKAILFLIYLVQERASTAGEYFIQYLLTDFPALEEYQDQFIHPFIFDHSIKVASLNNNDKQVVLNTAFFDTLTEMIDNGKLQLEELPKDFLRKIDTFFNSNKN
jgi:hypothetical protein